MFEIFSLQFDDTAVFDLAVRFAEEKFHSIYFDVGYSDRIITFDNEDVFNKFKNHCKNEQWYFVERNS